MRHLLSIILLVIISGCSVQVVDMAKEPTEQKFDLTDVDRDGVILARELCADSGIGVQVNNNGCSPDDKIKIRHELIINFDNSSYVVKPEFKGAIKELADFMKVHSTVTVVIEGHTSKIGSSEYNQKLSQNRAEAVKRILIDEFSIDKSRLNAVGYGFDRLLVDATDDKANARNRRVVAEISAEKEIKNLKWTIYSVDEPAE
jgi:outer membrane protein OmpA-like peptidoglycan-associated protein